MGYRIVDFSSDVGLEVEAATLEAAFVELGRGVAHVLTDGSTVRATETNTMDVSGDEDIPGTAVAFLNELVFLFDTEQFLVSEGALRVERRAKRYHVTGTLRGERFDPKLHQAGRGVKAATYHDATYKLEHETHRLHVVLDL